MRNFFKLPGRLRKSQTMVDHQTKIKTKLLFVIFEFNVVISYIVLYVCRGGSRGHLREWGLNLEKKHTIS